MFASCARAALAALALAAPVSAGRPQSFVRALTFKHRLRVCNAYPSSTKMEVFCGHERLTSEGGSMQYESCRDFSAPLKAGDKLEVKIGEVTAGTFAVSGLPSNDAVMLLVVHRHDRLSTAVAFESHVFAATEGPQIAIIDTFKGSTYSKTIIKDFSKRPRIEELRYDSVVAINPGRYQVRLAGQDGATVKTSELVALDHESYVLLRTGVQATNGQSFDEDLVVFPRSDAHKLQSTVVHSEASTLAPALAAILLVAGAMHL